ncbi:stimulated by retinoic acid gene 6 protein-like [Ptychodera flava]|uniref:stimulated by retinoic acid gene 6 protein-like n=1 Tax=Ptychodera flava TaxID=63121 RepID=UPI00396A6B72
METTSETVTETCQAPYERSFYYILSLSIIVTALLSLLQKRKRLWPGRFDGRPGIIYPVNLLDDRRNRLAYAAAFVLASTGPVTELTLEILFGESGSSNPFVRVAYRILKVLMYSLYYYPLFAAVTMKSIVTFAIGMAYSFILLGLDIADIFSCNKDREDLTYEFLFELPVLICLLYLAAIFSYKFVKAIMKTVRTRKLEIKVEEQAFDEYQLRHLRMLLLSGRRLQEMSVVEDTDDSIGRLGRIKQILRRFYRPRQGFKYSTRLISTMVVSITAVYIILLMLILIWQYLFGPILELSELFSAHTMYVLEVCWKLSLAIGFLIFVFTIPLILQGYRENMLSVFKGDHSLVAAVAENTSFSITPAMRVVSASRYAGFQVAYAVFGFLIHFTVLFAITGFMSLAILNPDILKSIASWAWPVLLIGLAITLVQYLLARFVFLQDRGRVFALDNRRLFHNCSFFAFLYNIYLGFFSSLMRLFKGVFFGALLFPRLDHSVLPRAVERFDPGFRAYVGFLQLENAHTHPVLVSFCRLLLLSRQVDDKEVTKGEGPINATTEDAQGASKSTGHDRCRSLPRNRWFLAFTLIRNPGLQQLRHSRDRRPRPRDEDFDIDQIVIEGIGSTMS